jgi:hypothetical protein
MPVTRERVDPIRTPDDLGLVHRRWLLPDDAWRPVGLPQLARLWRGLLDLGVLDLNQEVELERMLLPAGELTSQDLPAVASAGSLLAGSGAASLLTQVVWTSEEGRRDPYAAEDDDGFRDYTLYAVEGGARLFLPLLPSRLCCGGCGAWSPLEALGFGEGALLDLTRVCPGCGAAQDLGRDKGELRTGAVFLLEELVCSAALSIELPREPEQEELPDAAVSDLLRACFGSYDELADDGVAAAT